MYQILFVLFAAVNGCVSQIVINGNCPFTTGSMSAYNNYFFTGTWYQTQRISNSVESGDCSTTFFERILGTTIVNREVDNSREVFNNGTVAFPISANEPYRFTVTFLDGVPRDYYVIGSNFNGYALIGRCDVTTTNNVNQTSVYAWKLGRRQNFTTDETVVINQLVNSFPSLAGASWRSTSHDDAACLFTNGAGSLASSLVMIVTTLLFAAKESF